MMTDEQLIELIEQVPAEELTPDQLAALRARLPTSEPLQTSLQERLLMDQYLCDVVGDTQVSVDAIFAAAHASRRRVWMYWVAGLAAVLLPIVIWGLSQNDPAEHIADVGNVNTPRNLPDSDHPPSPESDPAKTKDPSNPDAPQQDPTTKPPEEPAKPDPDSDPQPEQQPVGVPDAPNVPAPLKPEQVKPDLAPWDVAQPPVPFEEAAFVDFPAERTSMGLDELKKWLRPVGGKLREVSQGPPLSEGTMALRPAWHPEMALRFSLHNHNGLRIYAYHGRQGVCFALYSQPQMRWGGYLARRNLDEIAPEHQSFVGTDGGRFQRSGAGTVELRYADGQMILSRGNVVLLAVPMPGPPDDVYFDGLIFWQGIAAMRTEPPTLDHARRPVVLRSTHPGRMAFRSTLPRGAKLDSLADGRLQLSAESNKSRASATLAIGEPGLYEVIMAVDEPQPGTGVFLSDSTGRILHRVAFVADTKTGWTSYLAAPDERTQTVTEDPTKRPARFAAQRQWLRMVVGAGTCKYFVSADGKFWRSSGETPWRNVNTGGVATLGIYCVPGTEAKKIILAHAEVREFVSIDHLVPRDLRSQALVLDDSDNWEQWHPAVERRRPMDVSAEAWQQACALRTLWGTPPPALARSLFDLLAETALRQAENTTSYVSLLEELAELLDIWDEPKANEFVARYFDRIEQQQLAGEMPDYAQIEHALMSAPIETGANLQAIPVSLVRAELVERLYHHHWEPARAASTRHRFWFAPQARLGRTVPVLQLIDWVDALAARRNPLDDGDAPQLSGTLRHPVLVRISKEGYNVMAEFEAALDGQSFADACAIISHANSAAALGLLPDSVERRLLVSLPAAIQQAMLDFPQLKQTMNDKFGPLGRLRIRTAVESGDAEGVQAATLQFAATEAAAQAHYWLGSRALSAGNFAQAIGHFQRAMLDIAADQRPQVNARLRLAGAMVGRELGNPVAVAVEFGGTRLSSSQCEQLVQQTYQQRRSDNQIQRQHRETPSDVLPLATYKTNAWAQFAGTAASDANQAPRGVDWAARQTAVTVSADHMLVSDRFRLSCYRLSDGGLAWDVLLPGSHRVHQWSQSQMRPLATGESIYVRRLLKEGPVLTSLNPDNGAVVWQTSPATAVASDPLWVNHGLYTMTIQPLHDRTRQLSLTAYDPETGEVISQRPLLNLRDQYQGQYPCNIAAVDHLIYGTVAGSVFCCDVLGQPRWLRRQTWFPPQLDDDWHHQTPTDPLIAQGRVFVSQPGVRAVECLDAQTGRSLWRTPMADLRRIVGRAADTLIVETQSGLQGLDADSGEFRWHFLERQLLAAEQLGAQRLLCTRRIPQAEGSPGIELIWLDPSDGQAIAHTLLETPAVKLPMLGPFVQHDKRTWALLGVDEVEPRRQIVELLRTGTLVPQAASRP